MKETQERYQKPFVEAGHDLQCLFYLGELVLLPQYRGQGIGKAMYKAVEHFAMDNQFVAICFSQIDDSKVSKMKPCQYMSVDRFWINLGFERHPELQFFGIWKDLDDSQESFHSMIYWMKIL